MRIKYIDVLKAFAIIVVVLYHAGVLTYGYLGVDLFLVIAGYLTTKSLCKIILSGEQGGGENNEARGQVPGRSGWRGYLDFEIGRVLRLWPSLLVAGTVCMVVGYFVMLPDDYENLSESVVASNCFANNILAAITTKNYWDISNEYKPLMHTWYVGLIMQFYIVYPILFYLARLDKKNSKGSLLAMISTLSVGSLLVYFGITDAASRFYYLPARFFEFAVGGIVALVYNPRQDKPFRKGFVYVCYVLMVALMTVNADVMPMTVRLVAVVALSVVLLCSQDALENKVTGNVVLAKVGGASYSIFIWHQVFLAFCRYLWTSEFSPKVYVMLFAATALLSWLTYKFVEQGINNALKSDRGKVAVCTSAAIVFVLLTGYAVYIYKQGGVVRDVPELYITKGEKIDHKAYNDKNYSLDKPFETNKRHWLVIGNSFGRDFTNAILESPVADSVEVSYIFIGTFDLSDYSERFANADRIFISSLGVNEELVTKMEVLCQENGVPVNHLIVVSEKNFGESNGQFYIKRGRPDYFEQRVKFSQKRVKLSKHEQLKARYGDRYLDMISLVLDENGTVPVFTPDHHFISQDCEHFSMGGAKWFGSMIDWNKYM